MGFRPNVCLPSWPGTGNNLAGIAITSATAMCFNINVNPTSEHELYLKLFITNGGGW